MKQIINTKLKNRIMKSKKLVILTVILGCFMIPAHGQSKKDEKLRVNQERIERRIFELAEFGKDENGKGYRVAFTKGDVEGRAWFIAQMKKAGLEVTIDFAGNIVGKRKGKNPTLKPIAFGSHIDMVPDGGNYDGCVGSISALEIMETLKKIT